MNQQGIPPTQPNMNQNINPAMYPNIPQQVRVCKKCGSTRVQAFANTSGKIKKRGCLSVVFHIFMTIITAGLWIIIPLLRGGSKGKIKTKIEFFCQDCGTKQ